MLETTSKTHDVRLRQLEGDATHSPAKSPQRGTSPNMLLEPSTGAQHNIAQLAGHQGHRSLKRVTSRDEVNARSPAKTALESAPIPRHTMKMKGPENVPRLSATTRNLVEALDAEVDAVKGGVAAILAKHSYRPSTPCKLLDQL